MNEPPQQTDKPFLELEELRRRLAEAEEENLRLGRELQRFKTLLDFVPCPVYIKDLEGRYLGCNRRYELLTGIPRGELVGKTVRDVTLPDLASFYEEKDAELFANPGEQVYEGVIKDSQGGWRDVIFQKATYTTPDGSLGGLVAAITDISDRKRAEKELANLSQMMQVAAQLPLLFMRLDSRGVVTEAFGDAVRLILGEGRRMVGLSLRENLPRYDVYWNKLLGGEPVQFESSLNSCGGETIYFDNYFMPDPHTGGAVGLAVEVSTRCRAEEALKASEEQYRRLFEDAVLGVFQASPEGRFIRVNPVCVRMFGFGSLEEFQEGIIGLLGHRSDWHPDKPGLVKDILAADGPLKMEIRFPKNGGGEFMGRLHCWAVRDAQGDPTHLEGFIEDVTERHQAHEALTGALKEKEVLLREIHHRVKNNMQVISSMLSLQAGRSRDPLVREAFQESQGRVQAMALIHQTLYQEGRLAEVDLGQYLDKLAGSLLQVYGAGGGGVELDISTGGLRLEIDKAIPLGLVLNELLTNSLKYAFPLGGGRVRIQARREGKAMEMTVADDGVGYPPGASWRDNDSLGMRLVVGLVEAQLQGSIELLPGPGAVFNIRIPLG